MQGEFDWEKTTLAHPGKRYQGQFIDGLVALFLFAATIYFFQVIDVENTLTGVLKVLVPISYFVFSDALPGGQSLGKKPFGFSVVSKTTGEPCNLWQSFLRNAFSPVFGILDGALIFGKNRQRLGDKFANTIVIKND